MKSHLYQVSLPDLVFWSEVMNCKEALNVGLSMLEAQLHHDADWLRGHATVKKLIIPNRIKSQWMR